MLSVDNHRFPIFPWKFLVFVDVTKKDVCVQQVNDYQIKSVATNDINKW